MIEWNNTNEYFQCFYKRNLIKLTPQTKVASFDVDFTIIKPTNNKKWSKTSTDWMFYSKSVVKKLKRYHKKDYQIVFYTNQKGLKRDKSENDKNKRIIWMNKIENILKEIDLPIVVIAAIKDNRFRKPRPFGFDELITCNKSHSFFCGDAGGLPKYSTRTMYISKDYSDSDLKFALNIGIKFIHRNEFIYKLKQTIVTTRPIDFTAIPTGPYTEFVPSPQHQPEMIINTGFPGSGKSHYTDNYILQTNLSYTCISRDKLKTQSKCIKEIKLLINQNKNIVIDNTNPSIASRKQFIKLALKHNYNIRSIHFTTSRELSNHNNKYRSIKNKREIVPEIAYRIYNKKFEEPSLDEGFNTLEKIDFKLNIEDNDLPQYNLFY